MCQKRAKLNEEAYNICSVLPDFQIAFAVHNSTGNLHLHIAIHPLNMATGKKLYFYNPTLFFFVQKLRDIFKKYDIRIDCEFKYNNKTKHRGIHYTKFQEYSDAALKTCLKTP